MVEEMLLERGIEVSCETVRRWGVKFGPALGRDLRRRAPRPGDVWRLDEVRVVIRGRVRWLWRAVDQHGVVLDEVLQRRRDERAARRPLVRLLRRQGWRPRRVVTDRLASHAAARREVAPPLEHRAHKGLNNRAGNSHAPFRRRERQRPGVRSPGGLQRFVWAFSAVRNLVVPPARPSPPRPRHPVPPPGGVRRMAASRRPRGLGFSATRRSRDRAHST